MTDFTKITLCITLLTLGSTVRCQQQQQQIDPAYLRSYYEQIQQSRSGQPEPTPIFEQGGPSQFVPSQPSAFLPSAQQIRVKDSVGEQVNKIKTAKNSYTSMNRNSV